MSSSPDPLNDPPTYQCTKPMRSSRSRYSLPSQASSPTKQTFELDIGNQRLTQKIRVTVETGSDVESDYNQNQGPFGTPSPSKTPMKGARSRTITTTIPLKGLSDSEDERPTTPKRGRGRPRKSATPVPSKSGKRVSTPVRKSATRRKFIGDLVDGDDDNDLDFSMGKNVEITRRGRPRSTSTKGRPRKPTSITKHIESDTAASSSTYNEAHFKVGRITPGPKTVEKQTDEAQSKEQDGNHGIVDGFQEHNPHSDNFDGGPSTYSTIRSTLPAGQDVDDIVVARFEPGNETPRMPGWSSPRYVEAARAFGSDQDRYGYPSPHSSPERSIAPSQGQEEPLLCPQQSLDFDDAAKCQEGACPEEDDFEEPREFDTILESEGFSMISVDSVPALREHLSSPAVQTTSAGKANLLGSEEDSGGRQSGSLSYPPIKPLRATDYGQEYLNAKLLSVQQTCANDSFSSISPEILDAASPAKKTHVSRHSGHFLTQDDSFSSITTEVLEAATPAKPQRNLAPSVAVQVASDAYNDSFSAIPSTILDAATPAPVRQMLRNAQAVEPFKLSVPVSTSATTRLLTPDDTPSPPVDDSAYQLSKEQSKTKSSSHKGPQESDSVYDSTVIHSPIASSPPALVLRRYTYTAHLRQHRQLRPDITQTPSIVFSSPSLPPPINLNRSNQLLAPQPDQGLRPTLSPIVRAGRVLQGVVVPTNSPRSRAQSLGSPFKSPVAGRAYFAFAKQNQSDTGLMNLSMTTNAPSLSSQSKAESGLIHQDDPFESHAPSKQRSPSPEEKEGYTLGLPQDGQLFKSRFNGDISLCDSIRSEDAMSWQAEQEVTIPASSTNEPGVSKKDFETKNDSYFNAGDKSNVWEHRWAAERAAVSNKIDSAESANVMFIESDDEGNGYEDQGNNGDDEDFGLLLETLNSSSPAPQQPRVLLRDTVEKPRRSKLPSPWRKNSRRLVYNDELYNLSATSEDLFRAIENPTAKLSDADPITVRRAMPASPENADKEADQSGWHIPQKSNFQPRVRDSAANVDLSAFFASSPCKPLPVLSKASQKPVDHKEATLEFSSSEIATHNAESADENVKYAPIPQKLDFQPRPRHSSFGTTDSSPIKASSFGIFGPPSTGSFVKKPTPVPSSSITSSKVLVPLSPTRTNSLRYPSQLVAPPLKPELSPTLLQSSPSYDSSFVSASVDENECAEIKQRTLKWTELLRLASSSSNPDLQPLKASPTKSCLRSPLKTPTQGTSSNLTAPSTSPSKTVAFVSSSPTPSSPLTPPLSTTTWTRDHWVLLDSILQSWKPENQSPNTQEHRRRNSTRVISKLLGRVIKAQGEEMRMEQWHLEVVDEFRGKVGGVDGWEEKVVARRVFALLVGERRRAEGLIVD